MGQRIYIADDEKKTCELITAFLEREGFSVQSFESGEALLEVCSSNPPDLVILDILMPGIDGLSVCSTLRRMNSHLPIIIVSAKDSPYDRVTGLTLGCDDYLVKPFLPIELVARVKALLRRSGQTMQKSAYSEELVYGPLVLYPGRRSATFDGKDFPLSPTEFNFLNYLISHADTAVSREELLNSLWQVNWEAADTRAADDLVKRLRRKLRDRGNAVQIETVWGYGFRLALKEHL